ncbi:oxidoreductase FAD/NAD(P)-binding domain-containing protein [Thermincola ferriacetica]|uniref:Oxidoreductase FAD/NAD(P)-binding domain-containing protein n=1 Tax=Thermincola ferriacetica TaxID=281456 RepID=A0A0L6W2R7_9FIRM|nr:FAD/NAD(P)-binding protein [Thermincola ferriacetica]KNZ69835.1 oxidoreductase FAD/NAD(P)-binding domain-containing protein [Thermincola ferriacetica]
MNKNELTPKPAVIKNIIDETADTKTFTLVFTDPEEQKRFQYKPAQFVEISVLGVGEAPISITSSPSQQGFLELSIKRVGKLTEVIHQLKPGDEVGIRGPYGNGFPADEVKGFDLLFVAGGIGLAPLRSLINWVMDNRQDYGKVKILYGARTPGDIVFTRELTRWTGEPDTEVLYTVDRGDPQWQGNVGLVTQLLPRIELTPATYTAFICGPPVMIPFVIKDLLALGFKEENIISTLENYMKCGIGKCGHCLLGGKYICMEGPVFRYNEMKELGFGE